MKLWRIYKYTNIITGQSYIGQTTTSVNRRAGKNGNKYCEGTPFRETIDEYGWDNFEQSILRLCTTQEEADEYERLFIDKYNTVYPNGYNLQSGGSLHKDTHKETRQKISRTKKGHITSEETKKKLSDSLKGKKRPPFTKEWKQNISKAMKEQPYNLKDCKWFNNGIKNVRTRECPEGYVPGKLKS